MTFESMIPISIASKLRIQTCLVLLGISQTLSAIPVRILAWDDEIASMRLALVDATRTVEIEALHPSKRSSPYDLNTGSGETSVEVVGKRTPEGKPCRVKVVIPGTAKHPLLLILPDAKAESGIRLHVLDEDESGFAWGSTRFINATGRKLLLSEDNRGFEIPATWAPVDVHPRGNSRNIEVKLFFREHPERPVYSAVWQYDELVRTLVFLVPGDNPRLGPIAMKTIPESQRMQQPESTASSR